MMADPAPGPELATLLALFPSDGLLAEHAFVPAEEVPQPYRRLLAHDEHMTVTVEAHHGGLVDVRVLESRRTGDAYARKIVLPLRKDGTIVLFGLVRIRLDLCSAEVRERILEGRIPLGRILIEHDVLRRIEPTAYLRVVPGPELTALFGLETPEPLYGRLALIHCDDQPAIELLEIVRP